MAREKSNWLNPETTAENEVLPRYFKWAWTSRAFSLGVAFLLLMQLTFYCTDIVGMDPKLVGTLLLASKILDGVTDLLVGHIIDKTNTRFGKARPYEIFVVFAWVFTVFLFSMPELSTTGKAIFVFVLYALINSVCSTFLYGGDAVYLARSVRSEKNRVSVMSFNGAVVMILSIAVNFALPPLIDTIDRTRQGWTVLALIFAVPCVFIGMLRFIFIKEVIDASAIDTDKTEKKQSPNLGDSLRALIKNKYIFILAGMTFIVQIISNLNVTNYYFKYIFGNLSMASIVYAASLVTPVVLAFFPVLSRKIGTVGILKAGAALGVIGYMIRILGGTNMITLLIGSMLSGIAVVPVSMMINIYLIDCMDYGEWKTGVRVEGLLASVNAFTSKLGSGIASGLVGIIMGLAGYDGSLAVQSAAADAAIKMLFNWIPMMGLVIMMALCFMYKLDKEMPAIKAELRERS